MICVGLCSGETGPRKKKEKLHLRVFSSLFYCKTLQSNNLTHTEHLISIFVSYLDINIKLRKVSNTKDKAQDKESSEDNTKEQKNTLRIFIPFINIFRRHCQ